jgi:hypothetical protein
MTSNKRRQLLTGAGSALVGAALPGSVLAATATAKTAVATVSPRTLIAAYFGGWRQPIEASQVYITGNDPWAMYPTKALPNVTRSMPLFKERWPLIASETGYDESQQWVIDGEIKTAAAYGIDVFAMNWYRDEFSNHPVVNFKASANKSLMKFFLHWSNNSNYYSVYATGKTMPFDSREYFFEGIRRAAIHMRDPSYYRIDGKPVFAIFDVSQVDRIISLTRGLASTALPVSAAEATLVHDAFLQDVHVIIANVLAGDDTGGISGKVNATVVKRGGVVPAKVNTSGITGSFTPAAYLVVGTSDVGSWARCNGVQGMYRYTVRSGTFNGVTRLTHNFSEMMTACQQNYDLVMPAIQNYAPGKSWWPTTMAGFDQRPWGGTTSDPLHDNCISTAPEFDVHCKQVRAAMDKYPVASKNTTFIYAWNELGEGGFVVPTRGLGTTRLESLKKWVKT